ncbi:trypsin-like peptidase domain-containing protein [Streptomonospora algeriensis]
MQGDTHILSSWHVCVRGTSTGICGGGVLITPEHVLTCAHVVENALGQPHGLPHPPGGSLTVEFPLLAPNQPVECRVEDHGWFPLDGQRGDLAVLRVASTLPKEARPAPLRARPRLQGRVQVYGHPENGESGRWATATAVGPSGRGGEWVQLDVSGSLAVVEGYSGCGVIDPDSGEVIGVAVSRDSSSDTVAFMVPVGTVAGYWPLPGPGPEAQGEDGDIRLVTDILLELGGIRDDAERRMYITQIRRDFAIRMPDDDGSDRECGARSLARVCLEQAGGMHALLEHLKRGGHTRDELLALERFARMWSPRPVLERQDRRELLRMLAAVDPRDLPLARLETSMGPAGAELDGEDDLPEIARHLEARALGPDGVPPLFVYVQQVANLLQHPNLQQWVRRVSTRQPFDPAALASAVSHAEALRHDPPQPFCTVELTEHGLEEDRFLVRVSAEDGAASGWRHLLLADDRVCPLSEVPARLEEALSRGPLRRGHALPHAVEFVLPRRLLSYPVDTWHIGSSVSYPLGIRFEVVVRSQDRVSHESLHPQWWDRWRRVDDRLGGAQVEWATQAEASSGVLLARMMAGSSGTCLVVGHDPVEYADRNQDIVHIAWTIGVPIMLWCRDDRDPDEFRRAVDRLLNAGGVLGLRRHVKELRAEAMADGRPEHLGHHLTLLWDDPERALPPDPALYPPR